MTRYAYFPGCSAHSTARDMHMSTMAVAESLGIELVEPAGWTCCGATAAHQTDKVLAASLAAANLAAVDDMGLDMVTYCAACYNRMKTANHDVSTNADIRRKVGEALGRDYDGSVKVRHFVELLMQDIGIDGITRALKLSLNGLKVACYYGCLLVRPPEVTKFDDPENPTCLEKLIDAMGGESLEWPHKLECCGGGLSLSRTDIVVKLADKIVGMAADCGADCIAVSCPMCQVNLDLRQLDIKKQLGKSYDMPVIYITQLLGLCLGISAEKLGFEKLMIPPTSVLEAVGAAV